MRDLEPLQLDARRLQVIADLEADHPEAAEAQLQRYEDELRPRLAARAILKFLPVARDIDRGFLGSLTPEARVVLREGFAALSGDASLPHRHRRLGLDGLRAMREPTSAIYAGLHLRDAFRDAHQPSNEGVTNG